MSHVRSRITAYGRTPKDLLRDPGISANAKVVYAMMDEVAGHEEMSMGRVASWLGMSEGTARRAVHELRDAGWVEIVERHSEGRQMANDYICNASPVDNRPITGGTPGPVIGDSPRGATGGRAMTRRNETYEKRDADASIFDATSENDEVSSSRVGDDTTVLDDGQLAEEGTGGHVEQQEMVSAGDVDPDAPRRIAERDRKREVMKLTGVLTEEYLQRVALADRDATFNVIKRAVKADRWTADQVRTALDVLVRGGKLLTVNSLSVTLEHAPEVARAAPARVVERVPCPCCVADRSGSALHLCRFCAEASFLGAACDHGASGTDAADLPRPVRRAVAGPDV